MTEDLSPGETLSADGVAADIELECPRCGNPATERFYGPCQSCRDQMRNAVKGEKGEVEVAEYEPKMNVTPNAVASKE